MKYFQLHREVDPMGISGTGLIAEGFEFDDGKVVMKWLSAVSSLVIHDNIQNVMLIHCSNNGTKLKYVDVWYNPDRARCLNV